MRMDESLWGCPRRSRQQDGARRRCDPARKPCGPEGWHPVSWRLWPALQVSGCGGSKLMITLVLTSIHNNARSRPQQPQAPQQGIDLLRLGRGSGPRGDPIKERLLGRAAGEDLVDDDGPLATEAARARHDLLFVS